MAVAALALGGLLAACSGGGGGSKPAAAAGTVSVTTEAPKPTEPPTTVLPTTTTLATGAADLGPPNVTAAEATGAAGTGPLDPTVQGQIVDAIHTYENAAIGTPLGTGQAAVLDGVLTPAAAARLTPPTRDALADEGMPAYAAIKADQADVSLEGFTGPDQTMVVSAAVAFQISASTPTGAPVKIVRNGSLTFVSDGGTWKIDSFDLAVERDIP